MFLRNQGTSITKIIANTSQMNSQAERCVQTVKNAGLTALRAANPHNSFRDFAFLDASDRQNLLPPQNMPLSPSQLFYGDHFSSVVGDITHILPFGYQGYMRVPQKPRPLQTKSIPVIYLRSPTPHVFQVLDLS